MWIYVKAIRNIYLLQRYFQGFCLDFRNIVFYNPSQWLFPNESTWDVKDHLLQVSFFLQRRQIILETFWFLISCYQFFSFFNFIWFYCFYFIKSKLLFYLSIFWNLLCSLFWKLEAYSFPMSDWLKAPALLYCEKKPHMINRKSKAVSKFLKITYD